MKYHDFNFLFDLYSERYRKEDGKEYDLGKLREKFSEIVDAVGIDSGLLKKHKDEQSGEMVKYGGGKPQFCFPEQTCDFCIELIQRYTSPDFKKIRSGAFNSVDPKESLFLIDGFIRYLEELGWDKDTICSQRWKMDRRLHHHENMLIAELDKAFHKRIDKILKDEYTFIGYEDRVCFIRYMVEREDYLTERIEEIFLEYQESRNAEIDDYAEKISKNMEPNEASKDILQSGLLADALKQDKEYQKALKKTNALLAESGFVQPRKGRYEKLLSKLSSIRESYKIDLFGEPVPEEKIPEISLKPPIEVLIEAIMSITENEESQIEREEGEAALTEEHIKEWARRLKESLEVWEKREGHFEIPSIEREEDDLFPNGVMNDDLKGTIQFPCCKTEKITVCKNSTGRCAIRCPNCGKGIVFNFDDMSAQPISDIGHSGN